MQIRGKKKNPKGRSTRSQPWCGELISEFQIRGCGSLIPLHEAAGRFLMSSSVFWGATVNRQPTHPPGVLRCISLNPCAALAPNIFFVFSVLGSTFLLLALPAALPSLTSLTCLEAESATGSTIFPSARGTVCCAGWDFLFSCSKKHSST